MKSSYAPPRGIVVVIATAVICGAPAHSAPKKSEPLPAPEQTPASKKGVTGKVKSSAGQKTKPEAAVPAAETKPGSKRQPAARVKTVKDAGPQAAPKVPPQEVAAPEKKGFIRNLFGRKPKARPDADAEPKLAKVKTVKPAPVKEVKLVKPARPDEKLAEHGEEAPKKKRGLFSFLRRNRSAAIEDERRAGPVPEDARIERPEDWAERSIVKEDEIALYEYGPSQTNGPDERLGRGTLVKVKQIKRGWALVEVEGGRKGYMDAAALRNAAKNDFKDPVPVIPAMASVSPNMSPNYWAPAAPPPDLPDTPGATDNNDAALLLLPPLELEPKSP